MTQQSRQLPIALAQVLESGHRAKRQLSESDLRRCLATTQSGPVGERMTRDEEFRALAMKAEQCTLCPRMEGRRRVLGLANGPTDARVLFVAEAPGRLGAEISGIPLFGDQTGKNFEALLTAAGLERRSVFITNAVLCNPQAADGSNDKPSSNEIASCNYFLRATIDIVDPDLVIALGVAALSALSRIEAHALSLRADLARPSPWYGRRLVALYHPSPRTRVFRSQEEQAHDLMRALTTLGADSAAATAT